LAIAHLVTHAVSRSSGGNAVHSCAYNTRSRMYDEQSHRVWDYSRKAEDVLWQGLYVPKTAPEWMNDRAQLWNQAERTETRINSRTARHIEVALPHELTVEQNRMLLQDFVRENFQRKGIVADVSMHRATGQGDDRNVHAHILLATRITTADGFGQKQRDLDSKETLQHWRGHWEKTVNRHLERHGVEQRIDMRSLADQGIDRTPGVHLGKKATAQERKGQETDRGDDQQITRRTNATRTIVLELKAIESGNTIDQAKQAEQKKRQAALEQAQRELEQSTRRTAQDKQLLATLHDMIRSAARFVARAIKREPAQLQPPPPAPRIEPVLLRVPAPHRIEPIQAQEIRKADSTAPPKKPDSPANDRGPSLMEILAKDAAKVRTVREETHARPLRLEMQPPRRRRRPEDEPI
jgi:hypothetical protein